MAGEFARAMTRAHGADYLAGTACEMLYPTSGDSLDFAFEELGAEFAYTVELRPGVRGGGRGGNGGGSGAVAAGGGGAAGGGILAAVAGALYGSGRGFLLPERQILLAAEEAWDGVMHVLRLIH